jgi:hypothetical protein
MIHHLTECKTDKTVIHKIEWNNEKVSDFQQTYKFGEKCMHKNKTAALNFIESMKKQGIEYVYAGTYKTTNRRSK